jgi:ethanolamine ammonia-lyase large subunit
MPHGGSGERPPDVGRAPPPLDRRRFVTGLAVGTSALALGCDPPRSGPAELQADAGVRLPEALPDEDVFSYLDRWRGGFELRSYRQILGAANAFKEGDEALGVAASGEDSRSTARRLIANTRLADLTRQRVLEDEVSAYMAGAVDADVAARIADWTAGELADRLLRRDSDAIAAILPGLDSDVIGCVVKLMTNEQLVAVSRKIFHPLPGSNLGAEGYLGARIQPNSPTDDVEDILWQVFDGWSYGVGDFLLGTNPVSSEIESVGEIQRTLADAIATFGLEDALPHCVLAHIDIQAEAERRWPGSTALWFQSLAGVEEANRTFDISVEKMSRHARTRTGRYGLYFETGQGADATNGHGLGFDMVIHEARKYGFARALRAEVAAALRAAGVEGEPWVHLNDVAGFIGPEVFRTREQLVRCCLEDTVMGKLHGLPIGLDICSTLHMSIDLDDLDWCIDRIMPANPAYLMALPTKNDPMLSYLTTGFQDHLRIRERFGYRVNDRMWRFFQEVDVLDGQGRPGPSFGRPNRVFLAYRRRKGDDRPDQEILAEGRAAMARVRDRGVFLAEGHGARAWDLAPELDERIRFLYEDAKKSIWAELPEGFASALPGAIGLRTLSVDRNDYVLHPATGEHLSPASIAALEALRNGRDEPFDVQLVISDGLNAFALTDDGHLGPFLAALRAELDAAGYTPAPQPIVVRGGRVRAGYRIGEILYGGRSDPGQRPGVLHVIGERPGSGHHAFSVYISAPPVAVWAQDGLTDHNVTRVVSGIADTAFAPSLAAARTVRILDDLVAA